MAAMRCILRLRPEVRFSARPFCVNCVNSSPPGRKKAWSDTRTDYQTSAMTDFVKDYRELSRLAMWDDLLEDVDPTFRVLDVCSGTGRFSQAFHELVLRPRNLKVVQDYTDLCGHSLEVLRERMAELGETPNRVFVGDCSQLTSLIDEPYDLIVNMHGLYGLPEKSLGAALQSMYDALKPGGHMVLSIGTGDSLYQRVPLFLYRNGYVSSPYTNNKDIRMQLAELGIDYTIENIVYYENFNADDKEGLRRFVMDECGGNTFSVEDASAQSIDLSTSWEAVDPLIKLYLDPQEMKYRFKQEVAIFKIEKTMEVLPPMLREDASQHVFFADAYTLRNEASTMQSSMIDWLKKHSAEKILSQLPDGRNRALQMLSVGCGAGEIDLAIMKGCMSKVGSSGQFTAIDFVGLEPNSEFHGTFTKGLKEAQSTGQVPSDVAVSISEKTFDGNFATSQSSLRPDLVVMSHVLYYFGDIPEKVAALRRAIKMADPQGRVVVIHQAAKGVPELQQSLLPLIRGSTEDILTADNIENFLNRELKDDIAGFHRHEIDAYLDLSEIIKGSPIGVKQISFCLEADHRAANDATLQRSIAAFQQQSVETAETGRKGGPFLAEPVVCFVIEPRK